VVFPALLKHNFLQVRGINLRVIVLSGIVNYLKS
jgi:hypothetical protein